MNFSGTWEGRFDWDEPDVPPTKFRLRLRQNIFGRVVGEAVDLDEQLDFPRAEIRGIAEGNVFTFRKIYGSVIFRVDGRVMTLPEYVRARYDDEVGDGPETREIDYKGVFTTHDNALAGRWNSRPDWVFLEQSEEWMPLMENSGLWIAHRISTDQLDLSV